MSVYLHVADFFMTLLRVESDEDRERHRFLVDTCREKYSRYRNEALESGECLCRKKSLSKPQYVIEEGL